MSPNDPSTKQDVEAAIQALLPGFYGYSKNNDARVYQAEINEAVLRTRMSTLEPCLTEVERGLNTPSQ